MVRTTFSHKLSDFLAKAFDGDGLRRFVAHYVCLEEVTNDLPGKAESLSALAHSLVQLLCRRKALTHEFFDALRQERKQWTEEIDRLETLANNEGNRPVSQRAHTIRLTAPIGEHLPTISLSQVQIALSPAEAVDNGLQIKLDCIDGQFSGLLDQLSGELRLFLKHRVNPSGVNKLAVFAFAPIPVLFAFGRILGDKHPTEVFDYHRHSKSWSWDRHGSDIGFTCDRPIGGPRHQEAALFVSVSGNAIEGAQRVVNRFEHEVDRYAISVPVPRPNLVRTRQQLDQFAELWQGVMAELRSRHERIHLFPATPLSVSVLCGCHLLPKADAKLEIYDYRAGEFRHVLTFAQQEVASAL